VDGGLDGPAQINPRWWEETEIKVTGITENKFAETSAAPVRRFERKFTIVPMKTGFALALLRQVCRADRVYPHDRVNSLYFDTADLDQYERSAAGELRKNKVRIRWYDSCLNSPGEVPVYLELKSREGFASSKQRRKFNVPPDILKTENLGRGILDNNTITATLGGFGYFPEKPLHPVIVISYRRYRFNEILSGVRVSFDYDIRASVVAPDLGRRDRELMLPNSVIEVKGPTLELPFTLRRMKILDVDWSRFSKYGGCLDIHFTEPGTIARLWPSGRVAFP
jgi:VTC domain